MRHILLTFLTAGLVGAFALYAQETGDTTEAAEETAAAAEEAGADEAATDETEELNETFPVAGENEDSAPKEGDEYIKETHGDWQIRCVKGQEAETCRLYQLLTTEEDQSIAEINIIPLPKGTQAEAGVTLITPLGTLLTKPIGIRVDAGKTRTYPYSWCTQIGCVSRFGFTSADIASMKKGAKVAELEKAVSNLTKNK